MHRSISRKLLKVLLVAGVVGFGLWSIFKIVEAQDTPQAPSESVFLPNITSDTTTDTGSAGLVYNFTSGSDSDEMWSRIQEAFNQYGTSISRQSSAIVIAVAMHGMQHTV